MKSITPGSVLMGLIISSPGLWQAWADPTVDITGAIIKFLVAVIFASVSISLLQGVIDSYRRGAGRTRRRSTGDRMPFDGEVGGGSR